MSHNLIARTRLVAVVALIALAATFGTALAWADVASDPTAIGVVNVTKVDAADKSKTLPGATFTLTGTSDAGDAVSMELTTDENGVASFTGVPAGSYTVTETKAPKGYDLPSEASKPVTVAVTEKTYTVTIGFYNNGQMEEMFVDMPGGPASGGCSCTFEGRSVAAGGDGSNACGCWDSGTHTEPCSCGAGGSMGQTVSQWSGDIPVWAIESAVDESGNTITGVQATNGSSTLAFEGERVSGQAATGDQNVTISYNGLSFSAVSDKIPSGQSYSSTKTATATQASAEPVSLVFEDSKIPETVPPATKAAPANGAKQTAPTSNSPVAFAAFASALVALGVAFASARRVRG